MGALLSLLSPVTVPITALVAWPMLSSWTTSLNLLFFSLTWTTIALTYTPLQIEFFGPLLIRFFLYVLPSTLFLFLDLLVPSLAVDIKTQGEDGLPQRQAAGRPDKIRSVVGWAIVNSVLGVAVQAALEWLATEVFMLKSLMAMRGSTWTLNHLPAPWTMAKHFAYGLVLRNVLQYYIHRFLLHSEQNSRPLTKWHRTWQHSCYAPYSFVAAYDHPVCYLLHRFLPLYIPAILFRFHLLTYMALLALTSLEEVFVYSGYSILPSQIMLRGMAKRTDAHIMSKGKGNYGPLGVLDWALGTALGHDITEDIGDEMDKHDVPERAGRAVDDIGAVASNMGRSLRSRGKKGKGNK